MGCRPRCEGAIQQDIGCGSTQIGELTVVESDLGMGAASQEASRINPVDSGRRKIGIRAPDAVEIILDMLQPAGRFILSQPLFKAAPGEYNAG